LKLSLITLETLFDHDLSDLSDLSDLFPESRLGGIFYEEFLNNGQKGQKGQTIRKPVVFST